MPDGRLPGLLGRSRRRHEIARLHELRRRRHADRHAKRRRRWAIDHRSSSVPAPPAAARRRRWRPQGSPRSSSTRRRRAAARSIAVRPPASPAPIGRSTVSRRRRRAACTTAFDGIKGSIDYRPDTLVWDLRHGALHCLSGGRSREVPYRDVILAPGARDRIIPFPGWTLPGIYTLGGAQIALKYQGCAIGRRIVFMGTGPLLYLVAYQYAKAGGGIAAVLDTTPFAAKRRAVPGLLRGGSTFAKGLWYVAALRARGIIVANGIRPVAAEGKDAAVSALRLSQRGGHGAAACLRCDRIRVRTELRDAARRSGRDSVRVRPRPAAISAGARHQPAARPSAASTWQATGAALPAPTPPSSAASERRSPSSRIAAMTSTSRVWRRSSERCGKSPSSGSRSRPPSPFRSISPPECPTRPSFAAARA